MSTPSHSQITGAFVFAGISAAAFWWGWYAGILQQDLLFAVLGALTIAAPALIFVGRAQPALLNAAGVILTIHPVATIAALFMLMDDAHAMLAAVRLWPLILGTLAALFAIGFLKHSLLRHAFLQGAFLLVLGSSLFDVMGLTTILDRWILRTPIHLCIVLVGLVVLCAVVRGFARSELASEERFISSMTQLLPLLGFTGTIWGITLALTALPDVFASDAGSDPEALNMMLLGLASAFETTLLGVGAGIAVSFLTAILPD